MPEAGGMHAASFRRADGAAGSGGGMRAGSQARGGKIVSSLINRLQGGNTQPQQGVLNEEQVLIQGPPPGPPPPPAPVAPLPHQPGFGQPGFGPPPNLPPISALLPEPKNVAATGLPL